MNSKRLPVDFMWTVALMIDALESSIYDSEDAKDKALLRGMVAKLDKWLERSLTGRFARRDSRINAVRRQLDAARRRLGRSIVGRQGFNEILAEISEILVRMEGWWSLITSGA